MNDLISRQAAIDEIDEWIKAFRENGHKESAADACLIQDGIIQLPSVDAVEVAQPNLQPTCNQVATDLISRQAAIDAIVNTVSEIGLHDNSEVARYGATFRQHEIIDIIEGVPSVQPEVLAHGEGELSAQPEPEEFEWCHDCKEYDREAHCCHRWTNVIRKTVDEIKAEQRWIPCSERLPGKGMRAVLLYSNEKISGGVYMGDRVWDVDYNDTDLSVYIIAWMPRPEQYKGEE